MHVHMHVIAVDCSLFVYRHVTHFFIVVVFYLFQNPNLLIWQTQDQEVFLCHRRFRKDNIGLIPSDLVISPLPAIWMVMLLFVVSPQIPTLKKLHPVSGFPVECNYSVHKCNVNRVSKIGAVVLVECDIMLLTIIIAPGTHVFLMGSVKCITRIASLGTGLHLEADCYIY